MSLNVSVGSLEDFVREKVSQGEYDSDSEVVRDALRLLKRREELWKAKVSAQIEQGMQSLRDGSTIPAGRVQEKVEARIAQIERDRGSGIGED